MPGDGARRVLAAHLLEHSGARDRQHHHAGRGASRVRARRWGGRARAAGSAPRARCPRRSAACARTTRRSTAPRPRSPTRDRRRCGARRGSGPSVSPIARVARQVRNATRSLQRRRRQPRRCHVDRLLEVRADERVGLVEDREDLERCSPRQEPFDRDLDARDVLLDEQRAVGDGADAFGCADGRHRVVGADHAPAGGRARPASRTHG